MPIDFRKHVVAITCRKFSLECPSIPGKAWNARLCRCGPAICGVVTPNDDAADNAMAYSTIRHISTTNGDDNDSYYPED